MARELLAACERGEGGWASMRALGARTISEHYGFARTAAVAASGLPGAAHFAWWSLALRASALHELAAPAVDALARDEMHRRARRYVELSRACARSGLLFNIDKITPEGHESDRERDTPWRVLAWAHWL